MAEICGWHNTDPDDPDVGIRPSGWALGCKNESDLPVRPIFRLYMSDIDDDLPEDNASIFAQCGVATMGGSRNRSRTDISATPMAATPSTASASGSKVPPSRDRSLRRAARGRVGRGPDGVHPRQSRISSAG